MAELETLRNLVPGWDGDGSLPIPGETFDRYLRFVRLVPFDRLADAEPFGTRDSALRMEWDRGEESFSAEIQADGSLYLCRLAADPDDDEDLEIPFDHDVLMSFFRSGTIPRT